MGQTFEGNVWIAPARTDLVTFPEGWTSLGDSVKININYKIEPEEEERMSDAAIFDEWVRDSHRLPDPTDTKLMRKFNVTHMLFTWVGGHYKLVSLDFDDGSSYQHGKVYE